VPRPRLFKLLAGLGRVVRPVLPAAVKAKVPGPMADPGEWPAPRHARKMLALGGCVQPGLAPSINAAAARVLDRIGISLVEAPRAGCCGALRFHLNYQQEGRDDMRALIDAWWPLVERGAVEAIVMTASGCGATVKEYGHLLAHDPAYRDKAARIAGLTKDLAEVIPVDALPRASRRAGSPSTLPARCSTASRSAAPWSRGWRAPGSSSRECATPTCAAARRARTRCCSRRSPVSFAAASSPR
jgi:hypothetical protein